MSSQQHSGGSDRYTYPQSGGEGWENSQFPLNVSHPESQQEHYSWQQQHTTSDFKVSDIDSFLEARPKREIQHASWNQDAVSVASQLSQQPWPSRTQRNYSVARTEPYRYRPGSSSVTTGDSGYGSQILTSGPTDHSLYQQLPTLRSLASSVDTGTYYQFPNPPRSVASEPSRASIQDASHSKALVRPRPPPCATCNKEFRNNSEANKHKLQHEKPFICQEDDCKRTQGFATKNDLERHRKTVHHRMPLVGKLENFICKACPPPQQGSLAKVWDRRDNFKAHIQRKHSSFHEHELIERSLLRDPADAVIVSGDEFGVDPASTDLIDGSHYLTDHGPFFEISSSQDDIPQGEFPFTFGTRHQNDELAEVGSGPLTDAEGNRPPEMDASLWGVRRNEHPNPQFETHRLSATLTDQIRSPLYFGRTPRIRFTEIGDTGNEVTRQLPSTQEHSKKHLSIPKVERSCGSSSSSGSDHGDGEYICPQCGKGKARECDLTKHMKRHTRPYGCTFPDCWKRFGSRNDWHRHEYSLHANTEMWRCGLLRSDQRTCAKVCSTVDDMRTHLKTLEHTQTFLAETDEGLESMHMGQHGRVHFWCGFCNTLIPNPWGDNMMAWKARSKHIGNHYDKDYRKIEDWVCVKENREKRYVLHREKKGTRQGSKKTERYYGTGATLEDDSDLGDDGIPLKMFG